MKFPLFDTSVLARDIVQPLPSGGPEASDELRHSDAACR